MCGMSLNLPTQYTCGGHFLPCDLKIKIGEIYVCLQSCKYYLFSQPGCLECLPFDSLTAVYKFQLLEVGVGALL